MAQAGGSGAVVSSSSDSSFAQQHSCLIPLECSPCSSSHACTALHAAPQVHCTAAPRVSSSQATKAAAPTLPAAIATKAAQAACAAASAATATPRGWRMAGAVSCRAG